ncbi:protein LIFEGUARD 4-like [Amaranthus tricolor]|uniref:protein LIFEGUARD 4-like n=1 Tax=Amaranthus tricolor TaxID=29722 RepID=UPI0025889E21|nr:protein LIFEGUARD 4-like [Amaranthus tricolor]
MGKGAAGDIETGQLYPNMMENAQFRWAFIRKVYVIIAIQMILTAIVASVVVFVRPISHYLISTPSGLAIYIVILISPIIIMCPLYAYMKRHPINFILLGLFTVAIAFGVGMTCAFVKGRIVLEALVLTSVVVVSLTLYTFWAAKRGQDFSFLGPFLFAGLMVLMVFMLIQIFIPLGKLSLMIYGCIAAILFSAYIVYDTANLIKRYSYDEYIPAAVSLYLDIINLFVALMAILEGSD